MEHSMRVVEVAINGVVTRAETSERTMEPTLIVLGLVARSGGFVTQFAD
jgi:hypothetical protein